MSDHADANTGPLALPFDFPAARPTRSRPTPVTTGPVLTSAMVADTRSSDSIGEQPEESAAGSEVDLPSEVVSPLAAIPPPLRPSARPRPTPPLEGAPAYVVCSDLGRSEAMTITAAQAAWQALGLPGARVRPLSWVLAEEARRAR